MQPAKLVDTFLRQLRKARASWTGIKLQDYESGRAIAALTADEQVQVVLAAVSRKDPEFEERLYLNALASGLLRHKLPFHLEHLQRLLSQVTEDGWALSPSVLGTVEDFIRDHGLEETIRSDLVKLSNAMEKWPDYADTRKAQLRITALLNGTAGERLTSTRFTTGEPWTRSLQEALNNGDSTIRPYWDALLVHCSTAKSSKPAGKWLKQAENQIAEIGSDCFITVVRAALTEIGKPGPAAKKRVGEYEFEVDPTVIHDAHSDLLRGLIWCTSLVPRDELMVAVGDAADVCFKKIPGFGPRAPKIGNACLYALSATSSLAAVAQLSRLKARAKHASIRKQLGKALDTAAENTGMSAAELEEVAVPTCGLSDVGTHRVALGEFTALLQISTGSKAAVSWLKADGKTQKSVPASVREVFPAELKALKQSEKEIEKLLPAQRSRLEQLFLQERSWSLPEFRSRYLDHPLVGVLARRLIWRYSDGSNAADGIWLDGRIVDDRDKSIAWLGNQARVAPWHPLTCGLEQVRAWRDWLDLHEIRQPFKQAHREIYVLTDAERRTETYSNRFAAHILRQHQFSALCQQRAWRYKLQGPWDSANTPTLQLPQWNMRAEFWVEAIADEAGVVFQHISTDQVRFHRTGEDGPMRLADVPPLIFSEILRDVDLFVGVASVGNDPNWADGGPGGQYRDYWQSYSFGELSATAQTRKALLERLIPRLRIADRCTLSDRFLIVRGTIRTYKIHLGSGNILMTPNDQYLCIVAKQTTAAGERVHLPFEGDGTLSIILSKAFLLANDAKITDPTITSQLKK
jgi:hypothetical protein